MSNNTDRPNSVVLISALLAVLAGAEVTVLAGDLGSGVRHTLGAVILVGLVVGAFQLSRAHRTSR
jgi:hypothetical protein